MSDTKTQIEIDDNDLGVWFSIDGKGIKTQTEMDLALIALAECYGLFVAPIGFMMKLHTHIHSGEEVTKKLSHLLIDRAEVAVRYLNDLVDDKYEFAFRGDEYENFGVFLK